MTLEWRPGKRYLTGSDHDALRRAVAASGYGVRTVLGVYGRAADAPHDAEAREDYCRFVRNALLRYGEVRDVVIWNEANSDTFWLPRESAAADYDGAARPLLGPPARVRPGRERPDDDCLEPRSGRVHPRRRRGLPRERAPAAALRRRRPQPLFALSRRAADRTARRVHRTGRLRPSGRSPRRVVRRDARSPRRRSGTSRTASRRLTVGALRRSHYSGRETVARTLDPEAQAAQIAAALRLAACQPRVAAYFNFLLVDETVLGGWQSGLLWADWRRKPAFEAYRAAIAEVRGSAVDCAAALRG